MSDTVFAYSRAQAITDGVLIDVTPDAKESGLKYPTAVSVAVWNEYVAVPPAAAWQDETGRLWDILWMLRCAVHQGRGASSVLEFELLVQNDCRGPKKVRLKAVCGPGDKGEPVITIMLPEED